MPTTSSGLAPLQSGRCCRDPRACACWRSAGCPGRRSMRGPRSEAVVGSRPVATTEETAKGAGEEAGGPVHGGRLVARTLASRGVSHLFTLSGGHLFSIYDGCKAEGIEVVDTRHEASAAWAAEGFAKATRTAGVCALTAGPGVPPGLLAPAARPAIMAGTGLYWARGEDELRALAEALGIPVFLNGMGRGCLPADHELCFSRARGAGLKGADAALVAGVPLDFRLGFGGSFGEETRILQLDSA